ncbi:MAG TPA: Trp biosynthesis-associated membrane protein [Streptosporangiaceae bacterium]|jgi:uncharacterized membrane protein (TIGR02234 family)
MVPVNAARMLRGQPRRELALVLLLGAAGAGLVFLATRQGWAQVRTAAPKPLPSGVLTESGQDLVPAAAALAVAALASLAAVLATRGLLRRIAGAVLAGFGAGIAAAVGTGISAAHVLAAARGSSPGIDTGGPAAGSVTAGPCAGGAPGGVPVTGLSGHVVFAGFPWHALALLGAAAVIAAGLIVIWRAARLPVMSSRYDRPGPGTGGPGTGGPGTAGTGTAGPGPGSPRAGQPVRAGRQGRDSAAMWESLSRGEDPTAGPGE